MRPSLPSVLLPTALLLAGCSDSSGPEPPVAPTCTAADAAGNVVAFAPFQSRTFRASEVSRCVWVTGNGARYLVVPQFATGGGTRSQVRYVLGSGGSLATTARIAGSQRISAAVQFDNLLRQMERQL